MKWRVSEIKKKLQFFCQYLDYSDRSLSSSRCCDIDRQEEQRRQEYLTLILNISRIITIMSCHRQQILLTVSPHFCQSAFKRGFQSHRQRFHDKLNANGLKNRSKVPLCCQCRWHNMHFPFDLKLFSRYLLFIGSHWKYINRFVAKKAETRANFQFVFA